MYIILHFEKCAHLYHPLIIILNRCYIELEELGKGRFSVVRKCQEIISGNEVAVKFINRRKQGKRIL